MVFNFFVNVSNDSMQQNEECLYAFSQRLLMCFYFTYFVMGISFLTKLRACHFKVRLLGHSTVKSPRIFLNRNSTNIPISRVSRGLVHLETAHTINARNPSCRQTKAENENCHGLRITCITQTFLCKSHDQGIVQSLPRTLSST